MRRSLGTSGRSGFSLAEVMGVVVVLGLLAGLVAVNWRSLVPQTQLNSAVHTLAAAIHGARSDAIARNAEFYLVYDLTLAGMRSRLPSAWVEGWHAPTRSA